MGLVAVNGAINLQKHLEAAENNNVSLCVFGLLFHTKIQEEKFRRLIWSSSMINRSIVHLLIDADRLISFFELSRSRSIDHEVVIERQLKTSCWLSHFRWSIYLSLSTKCEMEKKIINLMQSVNIDVISLFPYKHLYFFSSDKLSRRKGEI